MNEGQPAIGIAVTAYRSADVIGPCLDSLLASQGVRLKVVVVDNDSPDATRQVIRAWAARHNEQISFAEGSIGEVSISDAWLTLLHSPVNGGFARGTNAGLRLLMVDPALNLFWLLNPDCTVLPDTAHRYVAAGAEGGFALMGGRTVFADNPEVIQTDGGRVSRLTGRCVSVNGGASAQDIALPDAATLDYITGANCAVSRQFIERCGLLPEDYFLYYEEVEWALRRGGLPLRLVPGAVVRHIGGTAIGSGSIDRVSSPFAIYFSFRNRIRFVRRNNPLALPLAAASGLAHVLRLAVAGHFAQAGAVLAGVLQRPPPRAVRQMIAPKARAFAFGKDA